MLAIALLLGPAAALGGLVDLRRSLDLRLIPWPGRLSARDLPRDLELLFRDRKMEKEGVLVADGPHSGDPSPHDAGETRPHPRDDPDIGLVCVGNDELHGRD